MLIDAIVKLLMFLWCLVVSGCVGYVIGFYGFNRDTAKEIWNEFINDEGEEEDDETFERHE